ncbi:MAG: hypothetical protein KF773_03125 [Deltaproteobacteria bacterium]|nr:hypothetical protein [Deltaproteobacteria bacterium]MCW5804746.1 hypothetical protein [Deltaproteobacteria bacterium]
MRNVGGTPGGLRTFMLGIVMFAIGGYLLFNQVQVTSGSYWRWSIGGQGTSFGITLIPMLIGIGIMFVNGGSLVGRLLTGVGALLIVVGIIANLDIHFRQTSLFNTLVMLTCLVGGIGLVIRSVAPVERKHRDDGPR